jgi:uncharacterized UPF0160 family protein
MHIFKLSSASLIFKYFTEELLETYGYKKNKCYDSVRNKIYGEYIIGIDEIGDDYGTNAKYWLRDLAFVVSQFNKHVNQDLEFNKAVEYIKIDFNNYMESVLNSFSVKEFEFTEDAVARCDSDVIVSNFYISPMYLKVHADHQGKVINFLITKEEKGFCIHGIPVEIDNFMCKIFLKKEWSGLKNEELIKASGIKTAGFVHGYG